MTSDWEEGWEERREPPHPPPTSTPSSRGRHSRPPRAPDDYGDQAPQAPTDRYPQPDLYGAVDPYGQPGRYPGPDRSAPADPYAVPDRSAERDPLTAPGRYAPPDPLTAPGPYGPPDPLTAPGRYAPPDRSAQTDPYATRPHRVPAPPDAAQDSAGPETYGRPAYPSDQPFGDDHGRYGSREAPAGRGEQNGHGSRASYDPLTGPRGRGDYGPPDPYDAPAGRPGQTAERPDQNGYGPVGYAQPDDGPFRWRPSPGMPEPADAAPLQDLAPLPDYQARTEHQSRPGPRDWDPGQERDWDPVQDDSAAGLAEPVSGPVDRGAWPPEADEKNKRDDWHDAPPRDGLIPGFGDPGSGRGGGRRPRRRVSRVLAPMLALVLLAALGVGGYKIYRHFQSPDYTGPGTGEVTVQVLPGDTATSLAPRLVKLGVVASTASFISAAKNSSNPEGLEPGFFRLRHHMNSALAYALLLNPSSRIQSVVAIPEGLRETQILARLEQKTGTPASKFTAALKDTAALGLPSYANGNPEGYLFPATYNFNPGTSALAMLQAMVAAYNQEATSINLPAAAKAAQLTPSQVITVASILEAEAGNPKYYADVAEVIYNRLNQGMFLGLDSTVNYALHRFGVSLTNAQLHVNSPYNTFIHLGLPPGPIDSPGNAAIEAALHPAHGDLLYFVTVNLKTGLTLFTSSPTQFQQFEQECQQNNAC